MIDLRKDPKGDKVFSVATMKKDLQKSLNSSVNNCKTNATFSGFRSSIKRAPGTADGKMQEGKSDANLLPEIVTTAPNDLGITLNGSMCTSPRVSDIILSPVATPNLRISPECFSDASLSQLNGRTS